ncbi:hypothetical protein Leryth_003058 [Lithospermum erythrorhizon]|nr:hypothetical protein Leryth_003058 [Lithospermum erythrorhizon]
MDKLMCITALLTSATILFHLCEAGTIHIVGDTLGWNTPSDLTTYTTWAADKKFMVGDALVFNFAPARHDVQEVKKESYDTCSSQNLIGPAIMLSPANISLTAKGKHYYICTFPGHCQDGQKLAIDVLDGTSGAMPPGGAMSPGHGMSPGGSPTASSPSAGGTSGSTRLSGSFIAAFASLMVTLLPFSLTFLYRTPLIF